MHEVSVSTSAPTSALEELYIFVVDSDWLLMCDSKINERGLLSEFSKQFFFLVDIYNIQNKIIAS